MLGLNERGLGGESEEPDMNANFVDQLVVRVGALTLISSAL
jgi:hypothetical protein